MTWRLAGRLSDVLRGYVYVAAWETWAAAVKNLLDALQAADAVLAP